MKGAADPGAAVAPETHGADQRLRTSLQLVFLILLGVGAGVLIVALLWPFLPASAPTCSSGGLVR